MERKREDQLIRDWILANCPELLDDLMLWYEHMDRHPLMGAVVSIAFRAGLEGGKSDHEIVPATIQVLREASPAIVRPSGSSRNKVSDVP